MNDLVYFVFHLRERIKKKMLVSNYHVEEVTLDNVLRDIDDLITEIKGSQNKIVDEPEMQDWSLCTSTYISLCNVCFCMTKTVKGACGKCGEKK